MNNLGKMLSNEVFVATTSTVAVTKTDLLPLIETAATSARKRSRLCAHQTSDALLHEMLIALHKDTYIRPHKHCNKAESLAVLEGEADLIYFNDDGVISAVIELGDYNSGKTFYHRLSEPLFHTLFIHSEVLLIHETTTGPFIPEETVYPAWAPEEASSEKASFVAELHRSIKSWKQYSTA